MSGLLGKKIGMTSVFDAAGRNIVCTVIEAGPCYVTQVRTKETDGYESVQIGFGEKRDKLVNKPMKGHFDKAGVNSLRTVREFDDLVERAPNIGEELKVAELFKEGDTVTVVGTSKGKGFQGVVKRHGFSGVGGRTHGQHNRERAPGSLGASSYPSRVMKGRRMAGRTGGDRVTIKNLKVVQILADSNLILISGAIPGANNGIVEIHRNARR